jgi:hypothetical protein
LRTYLLSGVVAATLVLPAFADEPAATAVDPTLGTIHSPVGVVKTPEVYLGSIFPANVYTRAQHASGAVALRNRGSGGIEVSNVVLPVKAAFIYWAVITSGTPPVAARSVQIQRLGPTASAVATVAGTAIGTGASPCWSGDRITVYKAAVPISVANGAGSYFIRLLPGASGSTAGGNPWGSSPLPAMVGTNRTGTVSLFDSGLAGGTFNSYLGYYLNLPVASSGRNVIIDLIGADGQIGDARDANSSTTLEYTYINGSLIAGPSSNFRDSDWNGGIGQPLPQLWDTIGHQITSQAPVGTTQLYVDMYAYGDCLTPVANVVTQF